MFDILLSGGRIIDGSGNPWYYADVGIRDGKIVIIRQTGVRNATRIINVSGLVVCPGFIDMHVHSDVMLLGKPMHDPMVRQGITTELMGQDGLSYAPLSSEDLQMVRWYLSGLNGDADINWNWRTVGQYLSRFDNKVAVNVAYLVPHCALRISVLGMVNRLPSKNEITQMKELIIRGMEEGAVGFSTGLDYAPCSYSDTSELVEICKIVAEYGGIYVAHQRYSLGDGLIDPIKETIHICRETGISAHISHFKTNTPAQRGKSRLMLALLDEAREEGIDITVESYPYLAGSTMLLSVLPSWIAEGGPAVLLEKIGDPNVRIRIEEEVGALISDLSWRAIFITTVRSSKNREFEGKCISELAERFDKSPFDFVCDLLIEENLAVGCLKVFGNEEDVREIMTYHAHMVGSDAIPVGRRPHPRAYGTFPRYLGLYVRELGILTLEDAIRKMTSFPAQRLNLNDRGLLKSGMWADIVVFNPDTVVDTATFDNPRQFPVGIQYVFVNGSLVVDRGKHTGVLAGRALKPLLL